MASFIAKGIDVISNPSFRSSNSGGKDDAGTISLTGGKQLFPDDAIVEFFTTNETPEGELDGNSSFTRIVVYRNAENYANGIVKHEYVPQTPGQTADIVGCVTDLGDTYVRFDADIFTPLNGSGEPDLWAPDLNNLFVAPGSDASHNFGRLTIDHHTDQDLNGNGRIDPGTLEEGNGLFYVGDSVICFVPGTLISTPAGERPVETLRPGDRVITRDNGAQVIRWAGRRNLSAQDLHLDETLRPVLIRKGSLGHDLPERDLVVSPSHRMLLTSAAALVLFDDNEVLVAAKHLTKRQGIERQGAAPVTYVHFLCDRHEVVMANGAWSESFQPGDHSLRSMDHGQRNEILTLFPDLAVAAGRESYVSARRSLKRYEAALLHA